MGCRLEEEEEEEELEEEEFPKPKAACQSVVLLTGIVSGISL